MSNPEILAQLREKRSSLQILESFQEIAGVSSALVGILCGGIWFGSFIPGLDTRQVAQAGIGLNMTLVGAAWLGRNSAAKKLDKNWEEMTRVKQEISKINKTRKCVNCKYFSQENESILGCAVNPLMPLNCLDFEARSQVSFQDASGLNVVMHDCSESEIKQIKEIVNRVFNS